MLAGGVGVLLFVGLRFYREPIHPYSGDPSTHIGESSPKDPLLTNSASKSSRPEPKEMSQRERDLESLKKEWNSLGSKVNTFKLLGEEYTAVQSLIGETLDKLSSGQELYELQNYLKYQDYGGPIIRRLNRAVDQLLKSDGASEAREEVLSLKASDSDDVMAVKQEWVRYAGAGCDENSIHSFLTALESSEPPNGRGQKLRQDALLGYAAELGKTNPEKAVSIAVEQYALGITSGYGELLAKELALALPPETDFEAIQENILKTESQREQKNNGGYDNGIRELQNEFIKSWAEVAPADAANYFIRHAESYPASLISHITSSVGRADPMAAAKWARSFPEGEYRDAALFGSLNYLSGFPEEAQAVANEIQDADLRIRSEERAKAYFRAHNRSSSGK